MTLHQVSQTLNPILEEDEDEEEREWRCPTCGSQHFETRQMETWGYSILIDTDDPNNSYRGDSDYIDTQENDYDWICENGHYVYRDHELIHFLNERAEDV